MVVLASKIYVEGDARDRSLKSLEGVVGDRLGGLDVEFEVGLRHDDFPAVTIEGPDATAARNLLAEEFGQIEPDLDPGEEYVGTLESWDEDGIVLDAGQPVRIPADGLGLGPGSPIQIRERFGLVQHLPMRFVYGGSDGGGSTGDGGNGGDGESGGNGEGANEGESDDADEVPETSELAESERDRLFEWQRGPGRVNVNSATRAEVRATVNRAGHAQDIVTVERLGLLEQSVICRDDTDPPGLIASIGEYLPAELRAVV